MWAKRVWKKVEFGELTLVCHCSVQFVLVSATPNKMMCSLMYGGWSVTWNSNIVLPLSELHLPWPQGGKVAKWQKNCWRRGAYNSWSSSFQFALRKVHWKCFLKLTSHQKKKKHWSLISKTCNWVHSNHFFSIKSEQPWQHQWNWIVLLGLTTWSSLELFWLFPRYLIDSCNPCMINNCGKSCT